MQNKKSNFSEWYSEVVKEAQLADLRYNVKGFLVHRPNSVIAMKQMYALYEKALEDQGHKPVWFPAVFFWKSTKLLLSPQGYQSSGIQAIGWHSLFENQVGW